MKKIFFVLCILGFVLGLGSGPLYAWTCNEDGCTGVSGDITEFKTSKNVQIQVNSDPQHYAAISDHNSGDRAFGTSFDSQKIYYTTKTKGSHYTGNFTASDSSAFEGVEGWNSL